MITWPFILAGIITFFLTLSVDLLTDVSLYFKNKKVNHVRGVLLRLIGLIPACWLYWPVVFLIPSYSVIFDMCYNRLIGVDIFYIGTTSMIDKLQKKYSVLIVVKYIIVSIGILSFMFYIGKQ